MGTRDALHNWVIRFLLIISLLLAAASAAVRWWPWREVRYGSGLMVAPNEPVQESEVEGEAVSQVAGYNLVRLAGYEITARVLSSRRYRYERASDLVPIDLALGWGRMSDEAVLDRLEISQGFRFFFYRWRGAPLIPPAEIQTHAANVHIIPASSYVREVVFGLPRGAVVNLSGDLVRATKEGEGTWSSSLTRDDVGPGACEVLYARFAERVYPQPH